MLHVYFLGQLIEMIPSQDASLHQELVEPRVVRDDLEEFLFLDAETSAWPGGAAAEGEVRRQVE